MFSYFAYGLGIHSTLPLPEFMPAELGCDVVIRLEYSDSVPDELIFLENAEKPWYCHQTAEEIIFSARQVGVFRVRQGREVVITPQPGMEDRLISLYIVGTIMGFLSYQRGFITLHASAVEVDGHAIAFVGESGAGKSSTAAALNARGHGIVTDDVLAVSLDEDLAKVVPAFPQLKLSPEVAGSLGYNLESLHILHPRLPKLGHRSVDRFCDVVVPLKSIYVLAEGNELTIERLYGQQARLELVRHSYGVRALQQTVNSARYFLQCTELLKKVSIYRLTRPYSLAHLPDLAQALEAHFLDQSLPVRV